MRLQEEGDVGGGAAAGAGAPADTARQTRPRLDDSFADQLPLVRPADAGAGPTAAATDGPAAAAADEEAAAGAPEEDTDPDEDAAEVRNRRLRRIRPHSPVQQPARGQAPLYDVDFVMRLSNMRFQWDLDWTRIDLLNSLVPEWAKFELRPQSLTSTYYNKAGKECDFVAWYRDWSLTKEHAFYELLTDETAHVCRDLPDPDQLGHRLSEATWEAKWRSFAVPKKGVAVGMESFKNFFHHLFAKHMGEVAQVSVLGNVEVSAAGDYWPSKYFHPQFAIKKEHRNWMEKNRKSAAGDINHVRDAKWLGSTTLMQFTRDGRTATMTKAVVMSLPELFLWGGPDFTALELYFYYNNCLKLVKKRKHAWASQDNRDAAQLRYQDRQAAGRLPRYGHYRHLAPAQPAPAAAGAPGRPRSPPRRR